MPHDRYHPLSGTRGKSTTEQNYHVRLPMEMADALRAGAKERSTPTAVFIRDLLAEGLASRGITY